MTLLDLDRRHVWHPYTQHATERDPIVISRAKDASLFDEQGKEYLDLISSWWTCLHGHSHPRLNAALSQQAQQAAHIMFAGFTHAPAVQLAQKLSALLPGDLNRVFYSDNGSTAVEVALKLSYQYWRNKGQEGRKTFIAFDGAYHGDTFGAMAVGRGSGFFRMFDDLLFEIRSAPYPATFEGDVEIEAKENAALTAFEKLIEKHGRETAAVIVEPLLQGASGMRLCRPAFMKRVTEMAQAAGLLVIYDEVAVGFGRLGSMFACEKIGVTSDFICLSKGLTGGYMPMSVTVCTDRIFDAFLAADFSKAFAHGHSYTANPLGCALALTSLEIFAEENTLEKIATIEAQHRAQLERLRGLRPRVMGSLLAFDLGDEGYKGKTGEVLRDFYLSQGLNIRPLGTTVYLLPPYCITAGQLSRAYEGISDSLDFIQKSAA